MTSRNRSENFNQYKKLFGAALVSLVILGTAFFSFRQGLSQYYIDFTTTYASDQKISAALAADAENPDAYKIKGVNLQQAGKYSEAAESFKKAINLRPNDYFLWLQLGFSYYKLNNFTDSESSYRRAIELAPNYFEPKQYLGLLYLKNNDLEKAFANLSKAAEIDQSLFPDVLETAGKIYGNNSEAIENAVAPNSIEAKLAVAKFFTQKNLMTEKTKKFLTGSEIDENSKDEFISQLMNMQNYNLAFAVWSSKEQNKSFTNELNSNSVINGDFEEKINTRENNFGWRFPAASNLKITLDGKMPFSGKSDLEFEFDGNSSPESPFLAQLLLVKPDRKYIFSYSVRTQNLVSGGLPIIKLTDPNTKKILYQSAPITADKNQWQQLTGNLITDNQTSALLLSAERVNCQTNPCPIFGKLWLDNFVLKEVSR